MKLDILIQLTLDVRQKLLVLDYLFFKFDAYLEHNAGMV